METDWLEKALGIAVIALSTSIFVVVAAVAVAIVSDALR